MSADETASPLPFDLRDPQLLSAQQHIDVALRRSMGADINRLVNYCFNQSHTAGWWDGVRSGDPFVQGTKLMLIVTELAEAMEGMRKGKMDDHLPHRRMMEVELADAVIRICDLAGALNMDLGGAVMEKLQYNLTRADHQRENRAKDDGKKV